MTSNREDKVETTKQQPPKKQAVRRKRDDSLVQDLQELYKPVLDEPIPQEFLEILRRKRRQ